MANRFGPAGNSESFYAQGHTSTKEQPAWLHAMGLDAFEYSFGRGVRIREQAADEIRQQAQMYDIQLSVHAPYYINLATEEEAKMDNSIRYLVQSAQAAQWMGAKRVIFHPGVQGKSERVDAVKRIETLLSRAMRELDAQGFGAITFCPESMGKINQIGDLVETIAFCELDERLIPCLDFGHLHARTLGAFHSAEDFRHALDLVENRLGMERARALHVHFSRIEFTQAGEKRHWTYDDRQFGPDFEPLARELARRQYDATIICESKGTMAEDAATYKQLYLQALEELK